MTKKKIGSVGRFGARYGRRVKISLRVIEAKQRKRYRCPSCQMIGMRRSAAGIWQCKKCGAKYAGGAYVPDTSVESKG